jgi:hypothetical protein
VHRPDRPSLDHKSAYRKLSGKGGVSGSETPRLVCRLRPGNHHKSNLLRIRQLASSRRAFSGMCSLAINALERARRHPAFKQAVENAISRCDSARDARRDAEPKRVGYTVMRFPNGTVRRPRSCLWGKHSTSHGRCPTPSAASCELHGNQRRPTPPHPAHPGWKTPTAGHPLS